MFEIKIVSNTNGSHLDELKDLFQLNATRLIIASPFLASSLKELLNEFNFHKIKTVELITTFKPKDPEQLSKPYQLKEYFDYFKINYPEVRVKLHIDNELHGKVYVSTNNKHHVAILGSANFTRNGLCNNHEWGLRINDPYAIEKMIEDLFNSIEYLDVTYNQIEKSCLFADQYEKDHPEWTRKPGIFSDILENIYSVENTSNTDPQYFLKPLGDSNDPVLLKDKRDFSKLHQNLHFSKKKPRGVRKGDIVITFGVGGGALLSYFKVTGGLQHATNDEITKTGWKERWPWYMEGRNQSQLFAQKWWVYNIQTKDVLQEFLEKFPKTPITKTGGYSLGTLSFGNDKVRITKEFGEFLISKIESSIT